MKLNISYPATGLQKVLKLDDEKQMATLFDKRLSQEVSGDFLGDQFKGYIFKITGGNDKQGFTMKQGVLADHRVRLLLKGGPCYRPRRSGERKRKSVRGCIISHDISALALVVVKKGEQEIEGLTDGNKPRRLGPKRASKIRKLFALSKSDDVRKYVIRREIPLKEGSKRTKPKTKAPKIQRLVTPVTLQRKHHLRKVREDRRKKSKQMASAYAKLIAKRKLETHAKSRATKLASRLSRASAEGRPSKSSKTDAKATATDKAKEVKKDTKAKDTKTKEVKQDTKAKDTKTKDTKAKDTKAKDTKAKEAAAPAKDTKAKDTKAKDTKAKETAAPAKDTKAKDTKAKDTKAKEAAAPAKDTKAKDTKAKDTKAAPKADAPKAAAAEPAKKQGGDKKKKGGK